MPHERADGSVFLGARCGGCRGAGRRATPDRRSLRSCGSCSGSGFIGTPPGDPADGWSPYPEPPAGNVEIE